jgi:Cys-tRNA(Pro)/Cys-tRNA(Cys) deacylase
MSATAGGAPVAEAVPEEGMGTTESISFAPLTRYVTSVGMGTKTNAMRSLDRQGVPYQVREYEFDPDDLSAETVAAKVGLPPEQVFKTLAVRGDRLGVCLAVIPAGTELDFKALAKATGDRKIEMVPLKEVQSVTGYIRGGVTAIAAKKDFPVYIDETAELFDVISVSAGQRGIQLLLSPADYLRSVGAIPCDLARPSSA